MPVDPSKASASRRTFRKLSAEEETDIRRARGEISCAECRRLKLKCDKKLPCGSCVRRGCQSICPNGSLSTGQGTRFVLADTESLHKKIGQMGQRIRQLEDTVAIFQAGVSTEPHPLLSDELLAIKFGPEVHGHLQGQGHTPSQSEDSGALEVDAQTIDALGTLTIGDQGHLYFGRSAGSETLFMAGADMDPDPGKNDEEEFDVSKELSSLAYRFPLLWTEKTPDRETTDVLFSLLPPRARAWSLCETYMEQASWSFRPIKRDEVVDELLTPTYNYLKEREKNPDAPCTITLHKLAALYLVFALGALVDLTLPPYNAEAEKYFQLGRGTMFMRPFFDSPEIATVQSAVLMAAYHSLAGRQYTMDSAWMLISMGSKMAQSMGLHRDCARWNLSPKEVQRRRSLFWEIFAADNFHSMALGRPPSIRLSYVDCEFPEDDEAVINPDGVVEPGFWAWKHQFTKEVFAHVTESTLTATPPKYEVILELDRKVREKTLPASLNFFISPDDEHCTPSVYMRGCLLSQFRSVAMMYIHRSYFAQAILDHPINPLRSPYAPSFLAAYRCAAVVIKSNMNHFERFPDLCCRWWTLWTHLFSAAIIVGSIVTRAPSSTMAPSAFIELGLAVDLFQKGARFSRRARSGMAILVKLREKALQVYSQFRSGNLPVNNELRLKSPPEDDTQDELAIFGGQTRVLVRKILAKPNGKSRPSSSDSHVATPRSSSGDANGVSSHSSPSSDGVPDVHPSLVEYLSMFPNHHPSMTDSTTTPTSYSSPTPIDHQYPSLSQTTPMAAPMPYRLSDSFNQSCLSDQVLPQNTMAHFEAPSPFFDPTVGFGSSMFTDGVDAETPPAPGDLGMMMTGESGMDEQWMSFMRESGILSGTFPVQGGDTPKF